MENVTFIDKTIFIKIARMNMNIKKIIRSSFLIGVSVLLFMPYLAGATKPSDYGLHEGDTISAAGSSDPDIYIVNEAGYKRLFLNPKIFGFYGHLGGFAKVKNISPEARDAFTTSGLFRNCETNDPKVYGVESTGEDTGTLHWLNEPGDQAAAEDPNFFKKVFCINNNEFNWYSKSTSYTSVNQIPNYSRQPSTVSSPIQNIPLDNDLLSQMSVKIKCVNGWGSGTIIYRDSSSAIVFTNRHVTEGSASCTMYYGNNAQVPPENIMIGSVQQHPSSNPLADFSILTVSAPPNNFPYLLQKYRFCTQNDVLKSYKERGRVIFIGYPGTGQSAQERATVIITDGIVSGFAYTGQVIKSNTIIDRGNSGGLAMLENGCYIGMPTYSFYKAGVDPELADLLNLTSLSGIVPIYNAYDWTARNFISLPIPTDVSSSTPTPTPIPTPVTSCPANSHQSASDPSRCTCDTGYKVNSSADACILAATPTITPISSTPLPTSTPTPTPLTTPTPIPTPSSTPTPSASPTNTPVPTLTPSATPTPTPGPIVQDNFNSYADGSIIGQGNWSNNHNGGNFTVQGVTTFEGTKALYNNSPVDNVISKAGPLLLDGKQAIYIKSKNRSSWDAGGAFGVRISKDLGDAFVSVDFKKDGNVRYFDGSIYNNFATYNDNEWTLLEVEWRSSDKKVRYRVNSGTWTDWYTFAGAASFSGFDHVGLDFYLPSGSGEVYVDDLY